MHPKNVEVRNAGQAHLDRYYAKYPNPGQQKRANAALRFLTSADRPERKEPEKLAAGIIYAVAENDSPHRYGKDNPVKRNIRSVFKVDPDYISTLAVNIEKALDLFPQVEVVKALVKLARAWAPVMREQHPELFEPFGAMVDALTPRNKNTGTPKKPRNKRRPMV